MIADLDRRRFSRWIGAVALACAISAPAMILVGAVGARHGWFDIHIGFDLLTVRLAPMVAIVSAAVGLLALVAALTPPRRALAPALAAILLGVVTAGACGGWRFMAVRSLPVHDTATDWRDPLLFSPRLMLERGVDSNPVESAPIVPYTRFDGAMAGRSVAEANARTCEGEPIVLALPPARAYARLRAAVVQAGLELVSDNPQPDDRGRQRLEATATGAWFGFKDDLAARLQTVRGGTRIDLRVSSRIGLTDFGRGLRLIARLRTLLDGDGFTDSCRLARSPPARRAAGGDEPSCDCRLKSCVFPRRRATRTGLV